MPDVLAVTQQIYAAFGAGDIATLIGHLADDVQFEAWADNRAQRLGVPWMQPRHGKQGAAEFFQYIGTQLEIREFTVLAMMVGERTAAVEFVIDVKVPSTGRQYRDEEMHLWTFNEAGQVTRLRHYVDTAKHIHAAGLDH